MQDNFNVFCKAGLVVMNFLRFCLSGKVLISVTLLRRTVVPDTGFLVDCFLLAAFSVLMYLAALMYIMKTLIILWRIPCIWEVGILLLPSKFSVFVFQQLKVFKAFLIFVFKSSMKRGKFSAMISLNGLCFFIFSFLILEL